MAGGVGNLSVGLSLDYAAYTAGLTKAQAQAQQFSQQVKASFLGNLGAGLFQGFLRQLAQVPAGFVDLVKGAIDAADHLNDLSKKTGVAVETIGGIGFAAKQAGGDLESATAGVGKLNKSLAEAAAGNKEAAEAFKVLGVSVKDAAGNTISADQALARIADKFAEAADGPEKAAIALRIFGKAGADMIPLLDEGGASLRQNIAYFQQYSGVTAETAQAADEFNDSLAKLGLLNQAFSQQLATALLPTLQKLLNGYLDLKQNSDTLSNAASGIGQAFDIVVAVFAKVGLVARTVGEGVGALAAAFVAFQNGDFKQAASIFGDFVDRTNEADAANRKFIDGLSKTGSTAALTFRQIEAASVKAGDFATGPKKRLGSLAPTGGANDDPTSRLLAAQLKKIDGQIEQEKDLFQTRNRFLDFYNQQSLLSIQDYYSGRTAAQSEALQKESALIDQEIALVRKNQSRAGASKKDQAADEIKIQELTGKRTRLEQQAGEQTIFLSAAQSKAYKELADDILGVSAQVLDLRENFALAAAIRFDLQFDALSKTFTANGNQAGLEAIATLRAAAIAQGAFQKAALDSSRTLDALAISEERIALLQQTGAETELGALVRVGEERRKQIPILEAQVIALEAIAKAAKDAGTVGADDLARKADTSRLALDKLKASADPLAASLNKTFGGDFNSALDDFVTGTKSAADAFKSFAKSVLNDILKLGSKSITDSIFGGSGGAGGLISGLFSSGSAQGGASASGGLLSAFANLFAGFFADGGTIRPGQFGVVGENGPELAFGGRTGQTITPVSAGGNRTNVINVNVPAGASRDYGVQVGADVARQLAIADRRNN